MSRRASEPDGGLDPQKAFIRANTRLSAVAGLVLPHQNPPAELRLWQADEITPIWTATETELARQNLEPPFWAFPWAGGQGVARYILEHPETVRGKRVLDIACGGGLLAIVAAAAGAAEVAANDIDAICEAALALNAEANSVAVRWIGGNLITARPTGFDVILAGDVFYERDMSASFQEWFAAAAQQGATIFAGDPGRAYAPKGGPDPVAQYVIPTTMELEGTGQRICRIWRF
jgi:predicted nicotinamide N-methyase